MPLKLKRENGQIVAVGENPVIVDESGNESTFDIEGTIKAVKARNQEASELREKLARFKPLGDVDPVKAAEALELVSKLDAKKLLDSGDVEASIRALSETHATKVASLEKANSDLRAQFRSVRVASAFTESEFVRKRIATSIPVELLQNYFAAHFDIDEKGGVVSLDESGRPRMSKSNPAMIATFDEVLEGLVTSSPMRDRLLVSAQKPGTGVQQGSAGGELGKITRQQWRSLPTDQQQKYALAGAIID